MAFIINGEKIGDDVIEDEFESIKEHYINAGEAVCCDRDEEFQIYARDNVVNRVLSSRHQSSNLAKPPRLKSTLNSSRSSPNTVGKMHFTTTPASIGDEFMLRRKVKSSLMVDRYLEEQIGEEKDPTDEELKAFYEENIDSYMTGVEVEASQLFVEPNSHEAAKEVYDELVSARKEMLDGADFMELAKKHSGLDSDEINMGFIQQGQNMPEIDAVVFSMQPGEISPILATPFGFHLFNVTGRNDPKAVPMEEIPNLEASFLGQRREDKINSIIEKLKEEGSVEEVEEQLA